jgi:hypothetical protein
MPDIKALFDAHQATIKPAEDAVQAVAETLDALVKGCTENAASLGKAMADALGPKSTTP